MPLVRLSDNLWLNESIKSYVADIFWSEDWSAILPLKVDGSDLWITNSISKPLLIAHALGSEDSKRDTLAAAEASVKVGYSFLEVDVWQDKYGELRCHHGPEEPSILKDSDCTISRLVPLMRNKNRWLILDIKTDFKTTGRKIIDLAISEKIVDKIIFQVYRPDDVTIYAKWQAEVTLPSPILTAYASHQSLDYLLRQASRLHFRAFTFPFSRIKALPTKKDNSIILLTHPISNCADFNQAARAGISGYYVPNNLSCISP